jgi:hypothetical protein
MSCNVIIRSLVRCCAPALVLALALSRLPAAAGESKGMMPVSATVLAYSRVSLMHVPDSLVINSDDIRRGFVEVEEATALSIRSNNPKGHLLTLAAESPWLEGIQVRSAQGVARFGPQGGSIAFPLAAEHHPLSFGVRFLLSAQARAGVYAWPLSITVDPL